MKQHKTFSLSTSIAKIPPLLKKSKLLMLLMLFLLSGQILKAQLQSIAVTGFNKDVVANGAGAAGTSTTGDVDNVSWVFVSTTFSPAGTVCTSGTNAWPTSLQVTSLIAPNPVYTLRPPDSTNSLRLAPSTPGVLTLNTPANYSNLYFLATGGSGACTVTATVTFSDATTQVFNSLAVNDWCSGTSAATTQFYRIQTTNSASCTGGNCQYMYQVSLPISAANYSKTITSVSFVHTGGYLNVFALAGFKLQACVTPANEPTSLILTPGFSTLTGSFTASAGSPSADNYLIVRSASASLGATPVDGVTYIAGNSLGNGTVVAYQSGVSFTDNGPLSPLTQYYYFIFAANGACLGGPLYTIATPLSNSATTISNIAYTASGTWTCPPGVTSVTVECWGGGGAGGGATVNNTCGGGGAGGSYATSTISVIPLTPYTITVGATKSGATTGTNSGNPTWFGSTTTVYANGGIGGGPSATASTNGIAGIAVTTGNVGTTTYKGGDGTVGNYTSGVAGGAGGGGAGSTGQGNSASAGTGGAAKTLNGGAGANGVGNNLVGAAGSTYGGGGSGGKRIATTSRAGGSGAAGYLKITAPTPVTSLAASTLTSFGSACPNAVIAPNSFTIYGVLLTTDNITVGPLNGFTFSTTSGGTYSSSLSLTQPGGSFTQIIYVKFAPTAIQSYNGNIPISGGGATPINVVATGAGVNLPPTVSTPTSTAVLATTATLGGNITSTGCSDVIERGIYWSTTNGFADGAGTKVSETPGPYSTGVFTIPVTGLPASTTVYYKAFASNGGGTAYSAQGSFTTPCLSVSTYPWTENFDAMASIGSLIAPSCWKLESTGIASMNASGNTYNDPSSSPNYMTVYYSPSSTDRFIITPGFTLLTGYSYDFSFKWVGDNVAGWTADVKYNTTQTGTGSTLMGTAFLTSGTAPPATYATVTRTLIPATSGTYYFMVRVNDNNAPWYLGFDDFKVTQTQLIPPVITSLSASSGCIGSSLTITGTDLGSATAVTIGGTPATITANTATSITVTVGSGTTGIVSVTTPGGSGTSSSSFTVNPLPVISGMGCLFVSSNLTLTGNPTGGSWTSGTPAIATIDVSSGYLNAIAAGASVITYTIPSTGCLKTVTATVYTSGNGTIAPLTQNVCTTGAASPIVISGFGAGPVVLVNSTLASAPANTTVLGDPATPTPIYTGGVLQMYTSALSQVTEMIINNPNSLNYSTFTSSVDVNVYPTGGADGLSFNYGSGIPLTPATLSTANSPNGIEQGVGTGLSVCLKGYTFNTIFVKYNGVQIGSSVSATINTASGTYKTLAVSVNALNQVTVTYGGTAIYTNLQLPVEYGQANKSSWVFAIASRSGGVAEGCNIKNLAITLNTSDIFEYTFNGGTTWGSATTYTPPSSNGTYYVYYRPIGSTCPVSLGTAVVNAFSNTTTITGSSLTGQTACFNESFSPISVTATGDNLVYQWFKNTVASTTGGTSLGAANGAQTATYTPQSTLNGIYYYYCVVHGTCGTDQTSSVSGAFTVNPEAQPTLLVLTPDYTSVAGSFTTSIGADSYLVCRSTSPTFGAILPVNGTTYIPGDLIGTNTVVALTTVGSFNDNGLNQGTQYFYYIFAANSTCASGISYLNVNPLSAYTITLSNLPCVTPVNLPTSMVLTPGLTTVNGSFTGTTPNSDYYLVVRSTTPTLTAGPVDLINYIAGNGIGGGTVVANQIGSTFTFADAPLISGTHYYYHIYTESVFCVGSPLYSATSLTNDVYTNCIAPTNQPTILNLANTTLTSIAGSFTASANADHYLVVRNTTGTAPTAPVNGTNYTPGVSTLGTGNLVIASQSGTAFTDNGLTAATHYYYYVYGFNATCSNGPVYMTTSPLTGNAYTNCPSPTAQPTALVLTPSGNGMIISFTAAVPAPDHYLILRSTVATPSAVPVDLTTYGINSIIGNDTVVAIQTGLTFTNTGLTQGQTYYYFVYSANTTNCSPTYLSTSPLTGSVITGSYQSVPIANCNYDVVMNGNYIGTNPLSSTADCDDATYALCAADYTASTGSSCTGTGGIFWPTTLSSSLTSGVTYSLKPSTGNNAFLVSSGGTGTLTLSNPVTANSLYVLYFSAVGATGTIPSVVVNFSDLTTQTFTNIATTNWCTASSANCSTSRPYRAQRTASTCSLGALPYFSQMTLPINLANQNKIISSITIINGSGKLSVFAVNIAAMPLPTCWTPYAVTATTLAYSAHVSWTAPSPAPSNGYEYEIRTSGAAGSGAIGLFTTGTTTDAFVDISGLTPETTYSVYVRSYCGPTDGYSVWSNLYTFTTTPSCLPPTGVGANLVTATSAHIYWNEALIVPTDGYEWEIRTSGAPQSGAVGYVDDGATTALYEDVTSLSALTTYTLYVRGNCGATDGTSTWASYVFTTTPSCFTPTALAVSAITSTTATISWTPPAIIPSIGYEWEIRTSGAAGSGASGLAQSGSGDFAVVSANLVGLSALTTYSVYIRSNCDAGTYSTWSNAVNFTTPCSEVTIYPWTENFDGMGTIGNSIVPNCWKVESGSGTPWASANGASNTYNDPASSPYYITCSATPSATNKYLITPVMRLVAGNYYDISFKYVGDNVAGWTADVRYNTTQTGTGSTQLGAAFLSATTAQPSSYSVVDRLFFPTTTGDYYFIVHLNNTAAPFYFGLDDFMVTENPILPPTITSLSSLSGCVGNTLTITGTDLYPATAVSIGGTPVTIISDTLTTLTILVGTGTTGTVSVTTPAGTVVSTDTYTINQLPANPGNPTSDSPQCTIPGVTLTANGTPPVDETWYWHTTATATDVVSSGNTYNVNTSGTYYIRSRNNNSLCWSVGNGSATVTVNTPPAITTQPGNQSIAPPGTATFTTVASGTGLTYQWQEFITSWNNITNGGVYSGATAASLIITNPTMNMDGYKYRCVVSGTCTPSPATTNGNAILNVTYCTNTNTTATSYYISNFSTTGGTTNITNNGSGFSTNGYGNFTAMTVSATPYTTISFSITSGYSDMGMGIWIDWNHNGSFADPGEQMYMSAAYMVTATGSFTVPATALLGNTRMRLVADYLATSPTACNGTGYSECEDYTFNVLALPPPTITSLSATSGCAGSSLTITGTNYAGVNASGVTIGGTPVTSIVSNSGTVLVVTVGAGTTGPVSVTTISGTAVSTGVFTVNPLPTIDVNTNCLFTGSNITLTGNPSGGTWTSGTQTIATVGTSSGIVTGVAAGNSVITYTLPVTACTKTTTVTVNPVLTATIAPTSQYVCTTSTPSDIVISGNAVGNATLINSTLATPPNNTSIIGNAYYSGGVLHITDATGGQIGGFYIQNPNNFNSSVFSASFDMYMYGNTSANPADGMSFNYGNDIPNPPSGTVELGQGTGLSICMEEYPYATPAGPYICAKFNGVNLSGNVYTTLHTSAYQTVTVNVSNTNQLTVTIAGSTVISLALPASYASTNKTGWIFNFAARTGGENDAHWIKNVSITFPNQYEYSFNGGTTYQTANTFTPPTGVTATYNVYMRAIGNPCATHIGDATVHTLVCIPCATIGSPAIAATNVPQTASLNWQTVSGAVGYMLYFGTNNPPTNIANGIDLGNVLSYTPTALMNSNTTYYWKIAPYNSDGPTTGCTVWSFTTACAAPDVPATAVGTATGMTTANLSWTDPTASPTVSYYWAVGNGSNVTYDAGYIDRGITSSLSATTSLLACETSYYLAVKAYESCNTIFSNYITSSAFTTSTCPPAITSLSATNGCVGQTITITGTSLSGATSVKINGTAVASFVVNNSTSITAVVGNNTTGSGTVVVVTPSGTATSTGTYTISDPFINAPILQGTTAICAGATTNLTFNVVGNTASPFTLTYLPSGGVNTVVTGLTNGSTIPVTPSATTTYQIISVKDANGCVSNGNLIKNPSGDLALADWNVTGTWATESGPNFVTSYISSTKNQNIDLIATGYSTTELDAQPNIFVSDDYSSRCDQAANYGLLTQLRNSSNTTITSWGNPTAYTTAGSPQYNSIAACVSWTTTSHTYPGAYGTGLRYIYFEDAGHDNSGWAGNYGAKMRNATVKLSPVVTVHPLPAPPTGTTPQTFCATGAHTVANLAVTGSNIKWYDAATAGTLHAGTDVLANGHYYASQTTTGCESPTRLDVEVVLNVSPTPTGPSPQLFTTVSFVSNLVANGTGGTISWYDAATGGNLLSPTDMLVDGHTYYAGQSVNGCNSPGRLAVTVSVVLIKTVHIHVMLQGLFDQGTGTMLEAQDIDWGTGTTFAKWGTGIADRLQIELFEGTPPFTNPLVNISGIDLTTSGLATFEISPSHSGNYYIRVINRNHLEVWSAAPVSFAATNVDYNFTADALSAYQAPGGSDPQIQVYPGIYAMYLGDLDQSLGVDFDDFNVFEPYLTDGTYGFTIGDINGNGLVDFDDFNLFEPMLNLGPFAQYPGMKKK